MQLQIRTGCSSHLHLLTTYCQVSYLTFKYSLQSRKTGKGWLVMVLRSLSIIFSTCGYAAHTHFGRPRVVHSQVKCFGLLLLDGPEKPQEAPKVKSSSSEDFIENLDFNTSGHTDANLKWLYLRISSQILNIPLVSSCSPAHQQNLAHPFGINASENPISKVGDASLGVATAPLEALCFWWTFCTGKVG